jgi:hypothetical protein
MSLSKALEKVADKVVSTFGGDVTIRYVTAGDYNTTTGAVTESESDTDVKGVVEDVNVREANELIQAGDKRLTVGAKELPSAPGTKDRVVIGSTVYQIIRVETTEQANDAIIHELILRA